MTFRTSADAQARLLGAGAAADLSLRSGHRFAPGRRIRRSERDSLVVSEGGNGRGPQ
jgi:hypothetical protein